MTDHAAFMRRAIALSREHMQAGHGGPFGAVVVLDGKIIGEGWNQVTGQNDPTAHAEVVAIREACKILGRFDLRGATLYTSCEPCPMCLSAAYWARVDGLYYANTQDDAAAIDFDDAFLYRELALPMAQRSLPCAPLLRDEALAVFNEWRDKPDKVPY
ncbi:nucleoside deaminase [Ferrovibrio sp.]|uniref:nucleoside deaminase n=1 Tax=Ferrovibrio sp. TaxID=1917215 RepID=UPI001B51134F|nr:nucleoside deaminase [Ferrovibrio sp.]MBP7063410.1 nucleoside deaminase [Ferrovibrio sp.]